MCQWPAVIGATNGGFHILIHQSHEQYLTWCLRSAALQHTITQRTLPIELEPALAPMPVLGKCWPSRKHVCILVTSTGCHINILVCHLSFGPGNKPTCPLACHLLPHLARQARTPAVLHIQTLPVAQLVLCQHGWVASQSMQRNTACEATTAGQQQTRHVHYF